MKSSSRGQIVVEYVLLLFVAVLMATMIIKFVVSRDESSPGFLTKKWRELENVIGADDPNKR